MSKLADALAACARSQQPTPATAASPLRLQCTLAPPAPPGEIERAWPERPLPADIVEAWSICRQARLFEDADYGQWGLHLLTPDASAKRTEHELAQRPNDYNSDDIVIAEFLGDQDLLVFDHDGSVLVALPLDPRNDWFRPTPSLGDFLERYVSSTGAKYWEPRA